MNQNLRVLLVDGHSRFRDFVRTTLEQMPAIEAVGEASDGIEAVRKIRQRNRDLILVNIALAKLNGMELTRLIREVFAHSTILIVTDIRSRDVMESALSCGAAGYLLKSDVRAELGSAVEAVFSGTQFISTTARQYFQ